MRKRKNAAVHHVMGRCHVRHKMTSISSEVTCWHCRQTLDRSARDSHNINAEFELLDTRERVLARRGVTLTRTKTARGGAQYGERLLLITAYHRAEYTSLIAAVEAFHRATGSLRAGA